MVTVKRFKKLLLKRESGNLIHYTFSFILMVTAVLFLIFALTMRTISTAKLNVQDSLTSSLLAAAVPNAEVFGTQSGKLTLLKQGETIDAAYEEFRNSLIKNMGLDSNLNVKSNSMLANYITGKVAIRFKYYDATPANGNTKQVYSKSEGNFNGKPEADFITTGVTDPTIQVQLGFWVKSFEPGAGFLDSFGLSSLKGKGLVYVTYVDSVAIKPAS